MYRALQFLSNLSSASPESASTSTPTISTPTSSWTNLTNHTSTPSNPGPDPHLTPTSLYIIIGTITGVALIVTIALMVSLCRRSDDAYHPIPDEEGDRGHTPDLV